MTSVSIFWDLSQIEEKTVKIQKSFASLIDAVMPVELFYFEALSHEGHCDLCSGKVLCRLIVFLLQLIFY